MSSSTTPPRALDPRPIHQRRSLTRPKFLRRISDKFSQSSSSQADTSNAARREAALRERGLVPPSRGSTWPVPKPPPEPAYFADRPHYDASAAKRRREDALRERGLLPPTPEPTSAPVTRSYSNQSRERELELREKGLLPPSIHRHLEEEHEKHGGEWDATTLVDEIRMERSLGARQTAAERVKAEWETRRRSQAETRSDLLCPPRRRDVQRPLEGEASSPHVPPQHRPRPLSTPVSPSDDLRALAFPIVASASVPGPSTGRRPTTKDLPLLDTTAFPALTRSLSSPSLSGETLNPRQPLELKVHSPNTMAAEMEKIHDKESRRMTMLAFM